MKPSHESSKFNEKNIQTKMRSFEKKYATYARGPACKLDPSIDNESAQRIKRVCKRPELQPLLTQVSFLVSSELKGPFHISGDGKIVLSQKILDNSSLIAFHIRHALELVAWERMIANSSELVPKLAIAILGWHTAVFYYDMMIIHEKHLAYPHFPDWMMAARAEILRRYAEKSTPLEVARAIGQYWESLLSLQSCGLEEYLDISDRDMILEQAYVLASKALLLAAPSEQILTTNGDNRLLVNEHTGLNTYGCSPKPRPWAITFSSCTATSISDIAYGEVEQCRQAFFKPALQGKFEQVFFGSTQEIRRELSSLFELPQEFSHEIILTSSGTYAEFYPLCFSLFTNEKKIVNIIISPEETGSGTVCTASGRHFQNQTPLGISVEAEGVVEGIPTERIQIETISLRKSSGSLVPQTTIDSQLTALLSSAIAAGKVVLLHILDSSKTGLGAPSLETVVRLKAKYGPAMMVVVDAAQVRLGKHSLQRYLADGFMVLITGSKFFTGPPFAAALLVPSNITKQIDTLSPLPIGMGDYATKYDLPHRWSHLAKHLSSQPNLGLLLRWKAALWEIAAFHAVPVDEQCATLQAFEEAIGQSISINRDLEMVPTGTFVRDTISDHWENTQTIFSFVVKKQKFGAAETTPLTYEEGQWAYRWLNMDIAQFLPIHASDEERIVAEKRCHIGQPVRIERGKEHGAAALRIASGARLVSGVHFNQFPQARLTEEIQNAKLVLEKLSVIVRYWRELSQSDIESGVTQGVDHYLF